MMFLDEEAVRAHLPMADLIPAMEDALRNFSAGHVVQPVRVVLPVQKHNGFFGVMPAYCGALGAKLVTFYPGNTDAHTHHAMILLFRPETGEPLATLDGRLITEMRTAAVSAVATNHLARRETNVLGLLGSGVQARSHLEALRLVRKFREIRVWSPRNSEAFAQRHGVRAVSSPQEAMAEADVVVVATASTSPVLKGEWLSPGTHINAVGATRPEWRELDDEALRRSRIYVDSSEAALKESGDVIASGNIFAEIGEVINGSKKGREADHEITLFKSVGLAVEDVVAADLVWRRAATGNGVVE